ncbi:glycosyltransferase family 2 protein [Flavobacteriales bacterium]|nr:glycosyltransferase family 2 protein [Flavobacteriales bacterium]
MIQKPTIDVVIPAFNEQESIVHILKDMPMDWVREVAVVNNNSTDDTVIRASENGATVLDEPRQGYGYACLKGIDYLKNKTDQPDIIVFMDADYSDHPEELPFVVQPIVERNMDMVIGSRALGKRERKSMMPQQLFGNWLATRLIRLFYGAKFTDLGPFRALKFEKLIELNMQDTSYGWTVEMQVKAAKRKYKFCEVAVSYRERIGVSKVTGTIKGTILAGYKIIFTIFKYVFKK